MASQMCPKILLPLVSSVHAQRALPALAGSLGTAHVRGLSTSSCGLSEQQKPEGSQASVSTSGSTQQQQEEQQTSSSSSSDQAQNLYNTFKAGYEHVKSKAAGAAGSSSGRQEPAAKHLLQTLVKDLREVLLPAQDITSATRAYTGPVVDTMYNGPSGLILAQQQATGWQVLDNIQEKPGVAINWAKKLVDLGIAIARLEAERAAGERLDSIDAQLLQLRMTQAAVTQILLEQQRQGRAAGTAGSSGAGVADTATADAPAPRRLVDVAAKLRQLADNSIWELHNGNKLMLYVDAVGVVDRIRLWATKAMQAMMNVKRSRAPALMLISGLVKTGKSCTLEHVVPAVVAEALHKQGEEGPLAGMVVLSLNANQLFRQKGATALLESLLRALLRWACKEHVPMQEGALQAADDVLAWPHHLNEPDVPGQAICAFLQAVEVPVLVLFDEVQGLFLPFIDGKLDTAGAEYIRDSFMKELLVYGPQTVMWCITGSSMAHTWVSLAKMPANGYSVISTVTTANLPATYTTEHMSLVWEQLQGLSPDEPLDPKLLELCPSSIALLTVLVEGWIDTGHPRDVAAFVWTFMRTKLIDESLKEWNLGLEGMPLSQRIAILDLSFPGIGARIDTDLHSGLRRFLEPHLDRTVDGRYYLRDPHQRQIVRLLLNNDGTLRESWSDLEFSASLTQLDVGWNLLSLGEAADYLLGPRASRRWEGQKPPAGMDEFKAKLQAIADEIANKLASDQGGAVSGPQELWERQPWFMHVLKSQWNSKDRAGYERDKQAWGTHLAMLVFYLRLSQNVLAHTKPWDQAYSVRVDVDVIEALPRVLGQSPLVFNQVMVEALSVLTPCAGVKFKAQPSGGGSSIESLAKDEGTSSGDGGHGTDGISRGGGRGTDGSSHGSGRGTDGSSRGGWRGTDGSSHGGRHGGGRGRGGERGSSRDGGRGSSRDGGARARHKGGG